MVEQVAIIIEPRFLNIEQLMEYTTLGKSRAGELGRKSGAAIYVGRRVLYDKKKLDAYLESISERVL